jgi:HAD superfamily hydrolase (TIGR01484 family)
MRPVAELSSQEARALAGLLFDLDDTLLDHGQLTEAAYSALFRLRESGLALVAVTGRPVGWADVLARQWPVRAVIAENGAIACVGEQSGVRRIDGASEEQRAHRRGALLALVADIQRDFPELEPAGDVSARSTDYAFDIGERRKLPRETVERVLGFAQERGARTTVSSVHLHVSFEADDKASGAVRTIRALFELDPSAILHRYAFIGDSQNDAACFAAFHTTIAVANLSGRLTRSPRFVTSGARGAGFAEAARLIVEKRR